MKRGLYLWLFPCKDPQEIAVSKSMDLLKARQITFQKDFHEPHEVMYFSDTQKCVHYLECVCREILGIIDSFLKSSNPTQYQRFLLSEDIKALLFKKAFFCACAQTYRKIYKCIVEENAVRFYPNQEPPQEKDWTLLSLG